MAAYVERIAGAGGFVADVGTSQRFAKELKPFEHLFRDVDYQAFGFEPAQTFGRYNCDGHQDVLNLSWPEGHVDAVICLEVLEHVTDPFRAARELVRVLKPGGRLLLSVPFLTGYHGKPGDRHNPRHDAFPDFWRFTHEGLALMFRELHGVEIVPVDGPLELRLQFLKFGALLDGKLFRSVLDRLDRPRPGKAASRHLLFGMK